MTAAPTGALVRITYDVSDVDEVLVAGDALVTRTGRIYAIAVAKPGRKQGRFYLQCLVVDELAMGVRQFPLVWNRRDKGAGTGEENIAALDEYLRALGVR
jgi:hypothetical protein